MKRMLFLVALLTSLMGQTSAGWADDVDSDGEKLMALQNDPKYQEALQEAGGGLAGASWGIVCWAEYVTGVGMFIWTERWKKEPCRCSG